MPLTWSRVKASDSNQSYTNKQVVYPSWWYWIGWWHLYRWETKLWNRQGWSYRLSQLQWWGVSKHSNWKPNQNLRTPSLKHTSSHVIYDINASLLREFIKGYFCIKTQPSISSSVVEPWPDKFGVLGDIDDGIVAN